MKVLGRRVSVGRGVKLGRGSAVRGVSVQIGDGVTIGSGTTIDADEVRIGPGCTIEEDCRIGKVSGRMQSFILGDNCFIGNDSRIASTVFSTGDYVSLHNHLFVNGVRPCVIGHNVWVGQNCVLNARDSLTIGNGVGIGTYSSVWTHGAHGELIEGCLVFKVAPVTLEDDAWIVGSYNVISPGVTVGRRAIVLTGSVVTKDVPAGSCVGGNPARDLSDRIRTYRDVSLEDKYKQMQGYMEELASSRPGSKKTEDGWLVGRGPGSFHVRFAEAFADSRRRERKPTVLFTKRMATPNSQKFVSVFDLSTKSYTKRRTRPEIDVMLSLLYAKARFVPMKE